MANTFQVIAKRVTIYEVFVRMSKNNHIFYDKSKSICRLRV